MSSESNIIYLESRIPGFTSHDGMQQPLLVEPHTLIPLPPWKKRPNPKTVRMMAYRIAVNGLQRSVIIDEHNQVLCGQDILPDLLTYEPNFIPVIRIYGLTQRQKEAFAASYLDLNGKGEHYYD